MKVRARAASLRLGTVSWCRFIGQSKTNKQNKHQHVGSARSGALSPRSPAWAGAAGGSVVGEKRAGSRGNFLGGFILKQRFGSPGPRLLG